MKQNNGERELIYSTNVEYLAELLKQVLNNNNIEAFIFNNKDSSYHFGEIEVYVNNKDKEAAKKLVEEFENNTNIE